MSPSPSISICRIWKGCSCKSNGLAVGPQFSRPKIDFESSEAHAIWQRLFHGFTEMAGAIGESLLSPLSNS